MKKAEKFNLFSLCNKVWACVVFVLFVCVLKVGNPHSFPAFFPQPFSALRGLSGYFYISGLLESLAILMR